MRAGVCAQVRENTQVSARGGCKASKPVTHVQVGYLRHTRGVTTENVLCHCPVTFRRRLFRWDTCDTGPSDFAKTEVFAVPCPMLRVGACLQPTRTCTPTDTFLQVRAREKHEFAAHGTAGRPDLVFPSLLSRLLSRNFLAF